MQNQHMESFENLIKIGIALSGEHDVDTLLEMIFREAVRLTHADGATIFTRTKDQKHLEWKMHHNETHGTHEGGFSIIRPELPPIPLFVNDEPNLTMLQPYVALKGQSVNIPDAYESDQFNFGSSRIYDASTGYRVKSMLCVPMLDHNNNAIGVLHLQNAKDPDTDELVSFTSDQENLVKALASQAAVAINNAFLIQDLEETHQKLADAQAKLIKELEKELEIAHKLQMGLMPKSSPVVEGLDIAGRCIPATHVGGDFFQYFYQYSEQF